MEVTVRTPARLHFGMIDMRGDLGRIYCSVGVAIDQPNIVLRAKPAEKLTVSGFRSERVREYAEKILRGFNLQRAELQVLRDMPEHVGFGSGTQLALATGTALSRLFNLSLTAEEIAKELQRAQRSGVGTYAFKSGGFIVDGGHTAEYPRGVPPLIFRAEVPEDWLFVVGLPKVNQRISGARENDAFKRMPKPSAEKVGKVARAVIIQMIPSILNKDIKSFGDAMTTLDTTFGESWIEIQGGKYSHPLVETGIGFLVKEDVYGVGQSSWGPAFYGLVQGEDEAKRVSLRLQRFLEEKGGGEAFYTKANNRGAEITVRE